MGKKKRAETFRVENRDPVPSVPETPHDTRAPRVEYVRNSCCPRCKSVRSWLVKSDPDPKGGERIVTRRCKACHVVYRLVEERAL